MKYCLWFLLFCGPTGWANTIDCPLPIRAHQHLSESCVYSTAFQGAQFDNLKTFEPTYQLFSNGADKRRWIYLPPGKKIDTTHPDHWIFPVGTIFWKEFSLNGKRIETRQLEKFAYGKTKRVWRSSVYLWREDQSDADWSANGVWAKPNLKYEAQLHRSEYSVPHPKKCMICHRSADAALGFNYLNLSDPDHPGLRLEELKLRNWLTLPPAHLDFIPGSELDKKAIGYMQVNCASCHAPHGYAGIFLKLNHVSGTTSVFQENAYRNTAYKRAYLILRRRILIPGQPYASFLLNRMNKGTMPPNFAVRKMVLDHPGIELIKEWISNLPPE